MEEEKFHTITKNWSINLENTLKEIGDSCIGYKWMNIFAARKNEKKYNYLMYISITLAPITGILSAISTTSNYGTNLQILITTFSFFSGIISGIIKYSEFGDKALSYKTIASKYASLETNIKRQLSLPKEDRVNPGEYLEWITSSFDDLFTTSPLVSDDIYEQWVIFAKNNNLTITKDIGSFEKVFICKDKVENIEETKKTETDITTQNYLDGKIKYEMSRLLRNK